MNKINSKQAAAILGITERKLRTSRSTGTLMGETTPFYSKVGNTVSYYEDEIIEWRKQYNLAKKSTPTYIVWNEDRTEGYATTDQALAISAQKGDWEACGPNAMAKAFCEAYGDNHITNIEIK